MQKLILNQEQIDLYKELCELKKNHLPMRVIILKARQIGFSTFVAAMYFVLTIFKQNMNATIIADKADHASDLFSKYKFFYEHLPEELKLKKKASNAKILEVDYGKGNSSTIKVTVQGDQAGRSNTNQYLHLSETAFWDDLDGTMTSIMQTVSINNMDSIVIMETTGNGYNEFKRRWDNSVAGKSIFKPLFYPWWSNKDYVMKEVVLDSLYPHEEELVKKYNLSMEQLAWYRAKLGEMDGNLETLTQEYPSTPIEAFRTTGESIFDMTLVEMRKEQILQRMIEKPDKQYVLSYQINVSSDGEQIQLLDTKLNAAKIGDIKIYEQPIAGHPYVINCDPAMGGNDYFAIQVFDNYTGMQVATFHKNKVQNDVVAYNLVFLGKYYNNALICQETNIGGYILAIANKCGYKNIYMSQDLDNLTYRVEPRFGYKTKTTNRDMMISMFAQHFRDNYKCINDYETICEMENFQIIRNSKDPNKGKAQAIGDSHDDLVMAMAGVFYIRSEQSFIPIDVSPEEKRRQTTLAMFATNSNERKINDPFGLYTGCENNFRMGELDNGIF